MKTIDGGGAEPNQTLSVDGGGAAPDQLLSIDGGPERWAPGYPTPQQRSPRALYQGDPRLIMGPDGTRLQFIGGQPLTDQGLENVVLISLFTKRGWCGNAFLQSGNIGSDFEETCNQPITRQSLNQIRMAAEAALSDKALGHVTVAVTNPAGNQIRVRVYTEPPGGTPQEIVLTRSGANWQLQAATPAYPLIRDDRWTMRPPNQHKGEKLEFENGAPLEFENGEILEFQ